MDQHLADLFALIAGKIRLQRVPELGGRELVLLKDQFLDGGQGVGQVGDAHLQAADEVVNRAAFLQRQAAADAVFAKGRAEDVGYVFLENHVAGILDDGTVAGEVTG